MSKNFSEQLLEMIWLINRQTSSLISIRDKQSSLKENVKQCMNRKSILNDSDSIEAASIAIQTFVKTFRAFTDELPSFLEDMIDEVKDLVAISNKFEKDISKYVDSYE